MTRLPVRSQKQVPEDQRYIYDEIVGSRGEVAGPFQVLMNSPEVARRVAHLGAYLRFESRLPGPVRELAILTTAREWDCQLAWTDHEPLARKAGVRDEAIRAVRDGTAPESLDEEEATVVRYVHQVMRGHRVSEETFQKALERFGARGVTELTATLGYYSLMATVINSFDVGLKPGTKLLLPVPRTGR